MSTPPCFPSAEEYGARLTDTDFWWPYVAQALEHHGLADAAAEPVAGFNTTYPVFVFGDAVVKLFGYHPSWRESHRSERSAQLLMAADAGIHAPRLLHQGQLYEGREASWPYLVTTRVAGTSWHEAPPSKEHRVAIAADLGRQVGRIHALRPTGVVTDEWWPALDVAAAAERSSFPPHLIGQIGGLLARLGPHNRVFVNGDIVAPHVFIEGGRLTGIIDWGDVASTDRHYELAKLHLDTFRCDTTLLRAFLDASSWPVDNDFCRRSLGLALYRQAVGLTQHPTNDTFHVLPSVLPLGDIATVDELADALFSV